MLHDLRVLDISTGIAGPYCTKLLADAGADVVKVEPRGGDPLRASGSGALFRFLNTSKRSVLGALGDAAVESLAAAADVIVDDTGAGAGIAERHPGAIVVSISPFGLTGPWAHRAATEFTLQAWCGSTGGRGRPDGPPLHAGGRLGEWIGGTYAATAALAAWRGGRGEHIDLSLLECMAVSMNTYTSVFASFLRWPPPMVPARSIEIPSIEPTADGYVGFCTITAQQFRDFLVLIERPDLLDDRELASALGRSKRMDEILGIIRAWTTRHTTAEIIELASLLRIPVAPIGDARTVTTFDHFVERATFVAHPDGSFVQPRVPYRVHGVDPRPFTTSPQPGEHTEQVSWAERSGEGSEPAGWPVGSGPRPPAAERGRVARDPEGQDPSASRGESGGADRTAGPLAGLRILDFTAFWAGPAATNVLAALGADVIKVESVQRPDGMRFSGTKPPSFDGWWEWGPIFHAVNANKRGVTLDLTRTEGVALAKRLVAWADAVVENFTPRVMDQFGLGWDAVHATNPRVVMVRMPAFGLDGPWRDRTGFAQTMEQISGMASITGLADGPPLIPRGVCDPFAGMHAVVALLAALEQRDRDGEGRLVEVTMVEAALNAAAEPVVEWSASQTLLTRQGNRGWSAAPQGVYPCAGDEQWAAIAVATDEQWAALRDAMGRPAWAEDPSLAGAEGRREAHDRIDAALARWCADRKRDELVEELAARGVPAARVVDPRDVQWNAQLQARGFFEEVDHPVVGRHPVPALPFRLAGRPGPWLRSPAPTLGQHNDEVLRGLLGLGDDELARLRDGQVVGDRPRGL